MTDDFINTHNGRLDLIITSMFGKNHSRSEVQELIKTGNVFVANKCVKKTSFKLKGGEDIKINTDNFTSCKSVNSCIKPKKMEIDIVFENENLIIINKPTGLTVHPGAGNVTDTLVNGLLALKYDKMTTFSDLRGNDRLGIVHRLDKDTSGLMIVAKNNKIHRLLGDMIKQHIIDRRYITIVHGVPVPLNGRVENYICRDRKCIQRMKICLQDDLKAKKAITNYKVLKVLDDGKFSCVECKLETGRTHQIRIHMHSIKHPIVGEQIYTIDSLRKQDRENGFFHQVLHSYKLHFIEPITGQEINIEKQPNWLHKFDL